MTVRRGSTVLACQPVYLSVDMSVSMLVTLSICLSVCVAICISISPAEYQAMDCACASVNVCEV